MAMNRRQALRTFSTALGSVAFAAMTTGESLAARRPRLVLSEDTHFPAKAKNVIMLYMHGAPSHVDTFDYKPELIKNRGGNGKKLLPPLWKFRQRGKSGLWISDLFPNLAKQADELCLIRGMHSDQPNHATAERAAHTGAAQFIRPSLGAWSVYGLGSENSDLPGYVAMGKGWRADPSVNLGSAFLPAKYAATTVNAGVGSTGGRGGRRKRGGGDAGSNEIVPNISNPSINLKNQRTQLDLLKSLNQSALSNDGHNPKVSDIMQSYEMAFRMQRSMPELMDLSQESERTKRMYGIGEASTNEFGTQCLLARRMVESGVRFIELSNGGWDHHTDLKEKLAANCQGIDKPIAGLLADLKQRDLLKDTLVIWASEFGRTPHATGTGRGHNNKGYATWMAGGGVKPGFSYGSTDDLGYAATEGRMHTHDWHATILHLLGMDHEKLTYRHAGRDFRLTDVHGKVAKDIIA